MILFHGTCADREAQFYSGVWPLDQIRGTDIRSVSIFSAHPAVQAGRNSEENWKPTLPTML